MWNQLMFIYLAKGDQARALEVPRRMRSVRVPAWQGVNPMTYR
jgi:DNA-binding SARP family transcriptional activator